MKRPKRVSEVDWKAVESPELTEREFKRMRPAARVVPKVVEAARRARGRPKQEITKELVSMRLSPTVLAHFRGQGPGWQTRVNSFLMEFVTIVGSGNMPRTEVTKKLWDYIKRNKLQATSIRRSRRISESGRDIKQSSDSTNRRATAMRSR